jgi:hypothetical protein
MSRVPPVLAVTAPAQDLVDSSDGMPRKTYFDAGAFEVAHFFEMAACCEG